MKKLFATLLSLSLIIGPMPAAHASGGGIAKQVMGIANSVVGSTVIVKCQMASMQPSLMVYMAGSLVYVAAEISGGNKQKKQEKKQGENLENLKANMTEGGDYQKGVIQAQQQDEKDKLEVIQGRRKWMMATKAIYATATALAIYEWIRQFPPPPAGIGQGIPDIGACAPNPAANQAVVGAIAAAYSAVYGFSSGGLTGAAVSVGTGMFLTYLGIGSQIADMTMTALNTALGRVAVFAAATALVMVVDGELAKEESSTKKRISDLEKVNNQFNQDTAVDTRLAEGSSTSDGANDKNAVGAGNSSKRELKSLAAASTEKKQCFSADKSGTQYGEASCNSPIKLSRPNLNPQFTVPTLTAASNTATDLGNAVASGDMSRAEVEASKIAAMAGRIDAVKDSMMKKLNDQLKAEGKKPISIEDTLQDQLTAFNKELNKQKAGSGNFTMDDLGFGKNGGSSAVSPDLAAAGDKKAEEIGNPDSASGNGGAADFSNVDLANMGADAEAAAAAAAAAEAAANTDPFGDGNNPFGSGNQFATGPSSMNMNSNDLGNEISRERDRSIFKQVSQRYLLNYTKFFERKNANPPLVEAQGAQ